MEGLQIMHTENAFDVLSYKFRLFLVQICFSPETTVDLVFAAVTLHNMLETKFWDSYSLPENFDEVMDFQTVQPGSWRSDVSSNVFMNLEISRKKQLLIQKN